MKTFFLIFILSIISIFLLFGVTILFCKAFFGNMDEEYYLEKELQNES